MPTLAQLKAHLVIAPKIDPRRYLPSILFDGGYTVSTDGHRLLVIQHPGATFPKTIVNRKSVELAIKSGSKHSDISLEVILGIARAAGLNPVIDAQYPDARRAIPAADALMLDRPMRIMRDHDFGYLGDFQKVADLLAKADVPAAGKATTKGVCELWPNKDENRASLITFGDERVEVFGVLMPMRTLERAPVILPNCYTSFMGG